MTGDETTGLPAYVTKRRPDPAVMVGPVPTIHAFGRDIRVVIPP